MSAPVRNPPPLSVLTVTRRATTLARCLQSVARQDYTGRLEHLILVDDLPETAHDLSSSPRLPPWTTVINVPRSALDRDGPARLGALRNQAVSMARHDFIVFLDDDNSWDSEHLRTLCIALQGGEYDMAHTQRSLYANDGQPYLRAEFPWARDRATRKEIYERYVDLGVVTPGDNTFRDRMGLPDSSVDLGEWLLRRDLLREHPFVSTYNEDDWNHIRVEDRKLAEDIAGAGASVATTQRPTLRYYLGGYSNNFLRPASIYWEHPAMCTDLMPDDESGRAHE